MNTPVPTVNFLKTVRKKYGKYARHTLGFRHFAEGRDGMLPVHRRSIWSMHLMGARDRAHMTKTSKAGSYTTGSFHPHGEASVYSTIANLSQYAQRYPLVCGVGNFGWHNAKAAAPRYTSVHLTPYANTMFDASELSAVPKDDSYDGSTTEPRYLPVKLPHLFLAGCRSIATGYSGNIPSLGLDWVMQSLDKVVNSKKLLLPTETGDRWGGRLTSLDPSWLSTGKGASTFRPLIKQEKTRVVVNSLCPNLSLDNMTDIMEQCPDMGSISEESPEEGELVRIVLMPKRGGSVDELFKYARQHLHSRDNYSFIQIRQFTGEDGEVDFQPIEDDPLAFMKSWVHWRTGVVVGAANYRIAQHEKVIAHTQLLIRVIDHRAELIKLLEKSKDKVDMVRRIQPIIGCSKEQATTVAEIQFYRLASMNLSVLRGIIVDHKKEVQYERGVVRNPVDRLLEDAKVCKQSILQTMQECKVKKPKNARG
jgi:DNA gyrase subunit A